VSRFACIGLVVIASCSFGGSAVRDGDPGRPDADPNRPDADPNRPDADPNRPDANLAHPDAMVVFDAPPGTPDAPPNQPDAMVPRCPVGYATITISGTTSSSKYRFVGIGAPWGSAEQDCENDASPGDIPTHLAVIDSAAERTAIVSSPGAIDEWIGMTDLAAEGTFIYITPQASVLQSTPTGNSSTKDCVRAQSASQYQARSCTDNNVYVCECDGFTAEPARFPNLPNGN